MRRLIATHPTFPALVYFVAAAVWIAVSDRVTLWLFPDAAGFALVQTLKGWAFVAASAALIAVTSVRQHRVRALLEQEKFAAREHALTAYQRLIEHVATLEARLDTERDQGVGGAMRAFVAELGPWDGFRLWRADGGRRTCVYAATNDVELDAATAPPPAAEDDAAARAAATGRTVVTAGTTLPTIVAIPVEVDGRVLGVLTAFGRQPRSQLEATAPALRLAASLLGLFWHNQELWNREAGGRRVLAASEARLARRLDHISSLRRIDRAITSGQDLPSTLDLAVQQVAQRLEVDAACVLVFDPAANVLHPTASIGFRAAASATTTIGVDEGVAAGLAIGSKRVSVDGHDRLQATCVRADLIVAEGVAAYDAVPLRAHGSFFGVLEVFHRSPPARGTDWVADLETFGEQIAIAIDQAATAAALHDTNRQLLEAYDTTIEGWAAALDLRDEETQGHSRRVTDLTVRLAERLGVPEGERENVRRGALLHDIGKMGVPDSILLKPGPLDEAEWALMKQHPGLAHQLLSGTPFLRNALDIPYGHHEKWDGSGYPRGLAGDAIPLAARIFAVVDVFDALSNDRPYRSAWPRDRIVAHLRAESGRHFDPDVVGAFLEMVGA